MAGKPGRSGGRRPGAGRPKLPETEYQANMRALVHEVVTPEDWREVIGVRLAFAKAGNTEAYRDLEKWMMGPPPKELVLKGDEAAPLEIIISRPGQG